MRSLNLLIVTLFGLSTSYALNCSSCIGNPCGCSLFICSKPFYKPNAFTISKGFSGCQLSEEPLYDINFVRSLQGTCNCPYIDLDENCSPKRNSGIKIGTGIDLKFRDAADLLSIGMPQSIVTKLTPFLSQKEGLIDIIQRNQVTLTDSEALQFDTIMMNSISTGLKSQFNYNIDYVSTYGRIPSSRPQFQNLTRGVRSVLLNHEVVFGERKNYPDFWNYALTMQGGQMIAVLDNTTEFAGQKAKLQKDVLKYCFEKCSSTFQADVITIMDASRSIGAPNFVKLTDFVRNMINNMELSEEKQKAGLIIYNSYVREPVQSLTSNKNSIVNILQQYNYASCVPSNTCGTKTNLALERGFQEFQNYSRINAIKLLFVLTDGQSEDTISSDSIQKYKNLGVIRYAIGIGNDINFDELKNISGDNNTDSQRVYTVDNFDSIKSIFYSIETTQCTQALEYKTIDSNMSLNLGHGNSYAQIKRANINSLSMLVTIKTPTIGNSVITQNQTMLSLLRVYYSNSFELPCQYVNDGEGVLKGDNIELQITFQQPQGKLFNNQEALQFILD